MNFPPEILMYWIEERYEILLKKKNGVGKPWSQDPIFWHTYFCNVRREDDKVTKWIRNFYSPYVNDPMFEFNIVVARFLNRVSTLEHIGFIKEYRPDMLNKDLRLLAESGKTVWGNAYVITTCGVKQEKVDYLTHDVLPAALDALRRADWGTAIPTLRAYFALLEAVKGIGSFLAGQIIADLKNTHGHRAIFAPDWWTFVVPGPGSLRGCSWFYYGEPNHMANSEFPLVFQQVREYADKHWPSHIPKICNQDLQNCLCEYDKYMRVKHGTGRSKRRYEGA
jgi:hypothetical protein